LQNTVRGREPLAPGVAVNKSMHTRLGGGLVRHLAAAALLAGLAVACRADPPPRYGQAMHEIGRRFEVLGRAAAAGRYELARYELDELNEVVEDDLPRAKAPQVGDVAGAAASLRDMQRALAGLDGDL